MVDQSEALPRDIDALHALIRAERSALASAMAARDAAFAERDQLAVRNAKLEHILAEIRRAHFGRKSERISDDQLALALEDLEAALRMRRRTTKPTRP
jgi:transposase